MKLVYLDPATRDEVLLGPFFPHVEGGKRQHGFKELFNGVIWEVESEIDQVDTFCLFKLRELTKEKLAEYLERYCRLMGGVLGCDESTQEEFEEFVKGAPAAVEFLKQNFEQGRFKVYHGASANERGPLVFKYRDHPNKLLYLAHGLMPVQRHY